MRSCRSSLWLCVLILQMRICKYIICVCTCRNKKCNCYSDKEHCNIINHKTIFEYQDLKFDLYITFKISGPGHIRSFYLLLFPNKANVFYYGKLKKRVKAT